MGTVTKAEHFTVGTKEAADAGGIDRYVVAVEGKAIIMHRSNGQAFYMTYKSERGAVDGMRRAQWTFPTAEVIDKEESRG